VDDQSCCSETSIDGFSLAKTLVNDIVVVTVFGDVDMVTAPEVLNVIHWVGRRRSAALILDLREVTFLSVAGINVLIDGCRRILPHRRFGVVADGPVAYRPLILLGIDAFVALYRSLEQALVDLA
jgi:anti-sigma B factor antagonist